MCIICRGENISNYTHLKVSGCRKLKGIPELPVGLTGLECEMCPNLVSLPELPNTLTSLYCGWCKKLTSLPVLPVSLTLLCCSNTGLTRLPELPASLERLVCGGCTSLVEVPELPVNLNFYCRGCIWLPQDETYDSNVQKLKKIQKTLKMLCFRRRLVKRHHLKKFLYTDLVSMVLNC